MSLLLVDKDGTLVAPKSGSKFVQTPWDQQPLPGAEAAIAQYVSEGWKLCIISNQGGVAAGHKSLEDTIAEMRFCLELFPQIEEAYFCPDFEGIDCWRVWGDCSEEHCIRYKNEIVLIPSGKDAATIDTYKDGASPEKNFRKPRPGMLRLAIDIHAPAQTLYVGDMTFANSPKGEDEGAALAAGVPFLEAEQWRLSAKQF